MEIKQEDTIRHGDEELSKIRKILSEAGIKRGSQGENYTMRLSYDYGDELGRHMLWISFRGNEEKKKNLCKKVFEIFQKNEYRVEYSRGKRGIKINLTKEISERKSESSIRLKVKKDVLEMNIHLSDELLMDIIYKKDEVFQKRLLKNMDPKIISNFLSGALCCKK